MRSDAWYAALHAPNGMQVRFEPVYLLRDRVVTFLRATPTGEAGEPLVAGAGRGRPGREIEVDRACLPVVLRAARDGACRLPIAIEVRAATLERDPTLPDLIVWLADTHGIETGRLIVCIAGHGPRAVGRSTVTALASLRSRRIRIALAEVESPREISRALPGWAPDLLVLARRLAAGCSASPRQQAVLAEVVGLGRAVGVGAVASGLELSDDLLTLERLGVEYGSGALLGHPAPLARWCRESGAPEA